MLKLKLFLQEILIFLATGVLAVFAGVRWIKATQEVMEEGVIKKPAKISFWQFIIAFLIITSLILVFLKLFKGKGGRFFFQGFLLFVIFIGAQTIFSVFFPFLIANLLALFLVILRITKPRLWTHNLSLSLGVGGVSVILGTAVPWQTLAIILAVLSVYDIIAVYKTKHMVKMAKALAAKGALFALVIPEKFSFWKADIPGVDLKEKGKFLVLGTGDLALPIAFAVSVLTEGIIASLVVIGATLVGVYFIHTLFTKQKIRRPMPGLPPLTACAIVGFLIYLLIR